MGDLCEVPVKALVSVKKKDFMFYFVWPLKGIFLFSVNYKIKVKIFKQPFSIYFFVI